MRSRLTVPLVLALWSSSAVAQLDPGEVAERVHSQGGYGESLRFRGGGGGSVEFPSSLQGGGAGRDHLRRYSKQGRDDDLDERREALDARHRRPSQSPSFSIPMGGGPVGYVLLAIMVIGLVILGVGLLVALRPGRSKDSDPERPVERPIERPAEDELPWDAGDPDELAAQGRFREAILALLVSALKAVGWVPDGQRSRTAREILWDVRPNDPRRAPLGEVVGGAERTRFAGVEANRELYEEIKRWRDQVLASTRGAS